MSLDRISLLRNVGQFDNVSPDSKLNFTPFSLVYAENGRGKTTLAAILRSLTSGKASLIVDRQRLGAQAAPHIVITHQGNKLVFQNGSWNAAGPDIAIFDDFFVSENVCSGVELETAHRQNLHELILGAQGVALNDTLQRRIERIENHNTDLRAKGEAIPASARGNLPPNAFCALRADPDIDTKLLDAEHSLAAAKAAAAIRQRDGFEALALPDFDIAAINYVLGQTLADLEAKAVELVRKHFELIGDGGEEWVSDGVKRIKGISGEGKPEKCPFCSQDLEGSALINHYRAYFSQAYDELKKTIRDECVGINRVHGGDIPAAFERAIRKAVQTREFWKDFMEVPDIDVDTAAISREWTEARDAILEYLREKAASPLEATTLSQVALDAVAAYNRRRAEIEALSAQLLERNDQIDLVKEQAAAADVATLSTDLNRFKAIKKRFEPDNIKLCDEYMAEKTAKLATETQRDQAREALNNYRQNIFPAYEAAINDYLRRFNAGFRLGAVTSANTRAGSSANYNVVINQQSVNPVAENGPSFRNMLSAGDRNTLALAFFFASLEQDPNLAQKIVVIDDPMTSLDEHRSLTTVQEMRRLFTRVQQMIVLSHSKAFLCALWEGADRNSRTAMRFVRDGAGSTLAEWDVNADSITEHDRRHAMVGRYLQAADPAIERTVAAALRPILEAFIRIACPEDFPPGSMLGLFIAECRQKIGSNNEILDQANTDELRALLDYGNRFHHDTNPAWETAAINDQELSNFAIRTLKFTSIR